MDVLNNFEATAGKGIKPFGLGWPGELDEVQICPAMRWSDSPVTAESGCLAEGIEALFAEGEREGIGL
jgi:hypothetical protein